MGMLGSSIAWARRRTRSRRGCHFAARRQRNRGARVKFDSAPIPKLHGNAAGAGVYLP